MIGQQGTTPSDTLYGKPVPPPPDSTHNDGTVVPFVRADWNVPPGTNDPLTMERVLWLLEWHGWARGAALDLLAYTWVAAGIDGYGAYRTASPLFRTLWPVLGPDDETKFGLTFETKPPYGPTSAMTPAGCVDGISKATSNGDNLGLFAAKRNDPRFATGRQLAIKAAERYDTARQREKPGYTPWDSESGGAISQPIPGLDQVGNALGNVWDAATAVPAFLAKLASIIFAPSWWLRLGIGLAGVGLLVAALVLSGTFDNAGKAATAAAAA